MTAYLLIKSINKTFWDGQNTMMKMDDKIINPLVGMNTSEILCHNINLITWGRDAPICFAYYAFKKNILKKQPNTRRQK